MEFKQIKNDGFINLVILNALMYYDIDSSINEFQATNALVHMINTGGESFLAIGAYEEGELVGFSHGQLISGSSMFEFSGLYLLPTSRLQTKNLIDFSFDYIRNLGYTGWEVDATNPNISSIMEKYGAIKKHTRYTKEF